MSKLKLDLDQLDVQSFETATGREDERGTIRGHARSELCTPYCPSHFNEATTCQVSDLGTCAASCGASCPATCNGGATCVTCWDPQCVQTS
jgi:hypothetical protein